MVPVEELRRVEVRQADGAWVEVNVAQLEPGDVFRLFEPSGEPVRNAAGCSEFEATEHTRTHCRPAS